MNSNGTEEMKIGLAMAQGKRKSSDTHTSTRAIESFSRAVTHRYEQMPTEWHKGKEKFERGHIGDDQLLRDTQECDIFFKGIQVKASPREADSVMSFSLGDETFTSIPLPPRACGNVVGLTVLHGGGLDLVSFHQHRPRDIWTPASEDIAWRSADAQNPAGSGCRDPQQ